MERAVLVGLITPDVTHDQAYEYLEELAFLAKTAGAEPLRNFTQRLPHPDNKTFIGKGKIEEVKLYVEENEIDAIIFDDDLTPSQIRNLESLFEGECKILDRSSLILDIFASRAQTAQARTQVELAQYQYLLPRLTRMWTHLERQKGGIGMRGPGETQIETDRQIVRDKIALLKQKLQKIDKQSSTRRKGREHLIRVALVGYTNAGKSTLMNKLAKSEVFVENKLFATLDTTVRKVVIENLPFLLTDTVGFIRKLPHQLVESFKSTLDEVREADFMIHVVDISNPNFEDHIDVVNKMNNYILTKLGVDEIKCCFHDDSENCSCRKPKPGMIFEAEKKWNIDLALSYLIGDRWRDIETAKNTDITTILIDNQYDEKKVNANFECTNFEEAVNFILKIY